MMRSALLIWSSNNSAIGLSWSSASSAARCCATASGLSANRPAAAAGPSTTAITPSTVTRVRTSGQLKARMSGFGKASPLVSITMCSGGLGRSSKALMVGRKSSATVQQMQPLASSTMFSSGQSSMPQPLTSSPSTPSSPNSLMISAMRRPRALRSRFWIRLVFPAPRKPVTMVAGVLVVIRSLSLQIHRKTGRDEHHAIGLFGQPLVQDPGEVAKAPRQGIVRHDAQADLVRDEDHGPTELADRRYETVDLRLRIPRLAQKIAEPKGEAIDQDRRSLFRFDLQGMGEFQWLLDRLPVGIAAVAVRLHARGHFIVADFSGRQIGA